MKKQQIAIIFFFLIPITASIVLELTENEKNFDLNSLIFESSSARLNITTLDSPMPKYVISTLFGQANSEVRGRRTKKIVTIPAAITYSGSYYSVGPVCTEAMELALDRLRMQPNWLPDYDVAIELFHDECSPEDAVSKFMLEMIGKKDEAINRVPLMLLTDCDTTAQYMTAGISKNVDVISMSVQPTNFDLYRNRKMYRNYFGMGERGDIFFVALAEFIRFNGWKKIAILSEIYSTYWGLMDNYFIRLLDERNISLSYMGKLSLRPEYLDIEQVESTFQEIALRDPRIIVLNADNPVEAACWLYRYGMYGPNYRIFVSYWTVIDPLPQIPEYLQRWCTPQMAKQVIDYMFFYGDAVIADVFGYDSKDSTGMTFSEFWEQLSKKLVSPEQSLAWPYWPPFCYDKALVAGYLLNQTESILRKSNRTLSEWTMNGQNYKEDPDIILNAIREAVFTTDVVGARGHEKINRETTVNSGFVPVTLSQYQYTGNVSKLTLVAHYISNAKESLVQRNVVWNTIDNNPPRDSVRFVPKMIPSMSQTALICLLVFGTGLLLLSLALLIPNCVTQLTANKTNIQLKIFKLGREDVAILTGNILLLIHITIIPHESSKSININCAINGALIVVGYSFTIAAQFLKILIAQSTAHHSTSLTWNEGFVNWKIWGVKSSTLFLLLWPISQVALYGAFISMKPVETEIFQVSTDTSEYWVIYKEYSYICSISLSNYNSTSIIVILAVMAGSQVLLVFRAVVIAVNNRSTRQNNLKRISNCLYCQITIILAGCLMGLLISSQKHLLQVLVSSIVIAYTATNIYFAILAMVHYKDDKVYRRRGSLPKAQGRDETQDVQITANETRIVAIPI